MNVSVDFLMAIIAELEVTRRLLLVRIAELEAQLAPEPVEEAEAAK